MPKPEYVIAELNNTIDEVLYLINRTGSNTSDPHFKTHRHQLLGSYRVLYRYQKGICLKRNRDSFSYAKKVLKNLRQIQTLLQTTCPSPQ